MLWLWVSIGLLFQTCIDCQIPIRGSSGTITIFIRSRPANVNNLQYKLDKKTTPVSRMIIKSQLRRSLISGIYASYAGFISSSDYNGEMIFPRKTTHDSLTLVITPAVDPVMLKGKTVNNLMVKKNEPVKVYTCTRKQELRKKYYYWDVESAHLNSSRLPWYAIIFFADPTTLTLDLGTYVTEGGVHLLLPPLFNSKENFKQSEALRLLKINRFFAPVKKTYRFTKDRYAVMLT